MGLEIAFPSSFSLCVCVSVCFCMYMFLSRHLLKTELICVEHATYRECFGAVKLEEIDKREEEEVMNMERKCLSKVMETCTNSK